MKTEKNITVAENATTQAATPETPATGVCCPNCHHAIPMSIIAEVRSARMPSAKVYVLQGTAADRKAKAAKMPPQAKTCVEIMELAGTPEVSEADLMKLVADNKDKLRTRQDPWRIFQYYRATLNGAEIFKVN